MHTGDFTYDPMLPGYVCFTCWNPAHTGCGCHSVPEADVAKNIAALERMGYINRNAFRWNYRTRTWIER